MRRSGQDGWLLDVPRSYRTPSSHQPSIRAPLTNSRIAPPLAQAAEWYIIPSMYEVATAISETAKIKSDGPDVLSRLNQKKNPGRRGTRHHGRVSGDIVLIAARRQGCLEGGVPGGGGESMPQQWTDEKIKVHATMHRHQQEIFFKL